MDFPTKPDAHGWHVHKCTLILGAKTINTTLSVGYTTFRKALHIRIRVRQCRLRQSTGIQEHAGTFPRTPEDKGSRKNMKWPREKLNFKKSLPAVSKTQAVTRASSVSRTDWSGCWSLVAPFGQLRAMKSAENTVHNTDETSNIRSSMSGKRLFLHDR